MSAKKTVLLHHYAYDPLDRHVKSGLSGGTDTQLFYCGQRVATEIKGAVATQIVECEEAVLAYRVQLDDTLTTALVAGDDKRSTLSTLHLSNRESVAYTPYGASSLAAGTHRVHGFNGERPDPFTGHYLLGNGYRAFNPVLMRFNSPDSWSPFGKGGFNAYAYCRGEPVNRIDPSGHIFGASKLLKALGLVDTVPLPARPFSQTHQLKAVAGNPDLVEVVEISGLIALERKKDVFLTRTISQAEEMVGYPLRLNEQGHFVRADPIIPPSPSPSPAPHKTPVTDQPKVSNLLSASAHSLSQPSTNQLRQRSNPTPAIRTKIRES